MWQMRMGSLKNLRTPSKRAVEVSDDSCRVEVNAIMMDGSGSYTKY